MIAVDTNIIVRVLTNDDPRQARRAVQLLEKNDIFISKTVILETEWVLRHAYGIDADTIISGFQKLFGLAGVTVEDSWAIFQSLNWHREGLDFADALHMASGMRSSHFATFDKSLIKKSSRIKVIEVMEP